MNDYLCHLLAVESGTSTLSHERWVLRSKVVTRRFKNTYTALIKGPALDYDPLTFAQDYPTAGWVPSGCAAAAFVTLRDKHGDLVEPPLVVKVQKSGNRWMIDGAGVIDIPDSKRAPGD